MTELSSGTKLLLILLNDENTEGYIQNLSMCGDNCAKWLQRISEKKDIVARLGHIIEAKIDGKRFKIELTRNISVIVDNSATGKTTFAQGLLGIKSGSTPTNKILRASCSYVVLTEDFLQIW